MDGFTTSIIAVLGALFMIHSAVAETLHVVGDSLGWTKPPHDPATYSNWASGKTFYVGDKLQFNFDSNIHNVVQVPKASFDACTSDNAIGNVISNAPANIALSSAGEQYYICTVREHCQEGQKLAISVSDKPGTDNPSPPAPPPPPPPSDSPDPDTPPPLPLPPPPPSSNQTDDSVPAPTLSFNPANPAGGSIIPPPSPSSSTAMFASLLFTLGFIAMGVILV